MHRGLYVETPIAGDRFSVRDALDLARVAAVAASLPGEYVVSHESAAVMWGLPLLRPPRHVHVVQPSRASARSADGIARHRVPVPAEQVRVRGGIPVTSLERTAVDCARTLGASAGLVILDAALHRGADPDLCREMVRQAGAGRGVRVARAVLAAADGGAESPGESLARLAVLRLGVRAPTTQVAVETDLGVFWTDLGWPEWGVLAEYDGERKYGSNGDAVGVVLREKRRQEAIEERGRTLLRLTKDDVDRPPLLRRRLRRVLPADAFGQEVDPYLSHG